MCIDDNDANGENGEKQNVANGENGVKGGSLLNIAIDVIRSYRNLN